MADGGDGFSDMGVVMHAVTGGTYGRDGTMNQVSYVGTGSGQRRDNPMNRTYRKNTKSLLKFVTDGKPERTLYYLRKGYEAEYGAIAKEMARLGNYDELRRLFVQVKGLPGDDYARLHSAELVRRAKNKKYQAVVEALLVATYLGNLSDGGGKIWKKMFESMMYTSVSADNLRLWLILENATSSGHKIPCYMKIYYDNWNCVPKMDPLLKVLVVRRAKLSLHPPLKRYAECEDEDRRPYLKDAIRTVLEQCDEPTAIHCKALCPEGYDALHLAAKMGWLGVAKGQVRAGADLGKRVGFRRRTALAIAEHEGHAEVAQFLRDAAADDGVQAKLQAEARSRQEALEAEDAAFKAKILAKYCSGDKAVPFKSRGTALVSDDGAKAKGKKTNKKAEDEGTSVGSGKSDDGGKAKGKKTKKKEAKGEATLAGSGKITEVRGNSTDADTGGDTTGWSVHQWLVSLDLAEYEDMFIESGYDRKALIDTLTDDELRTDIGVDKPGHRKLILRSIPQKS